MNNPMCENCKYCDPEFGCVCDQTIYPCEKEAIDNILDDLDIEI